MILAHPHLWASTAGGYKCETCDAKISDAEVRSNPAPTGVAAAAHVERKLGK